MLSSEPTQYIRGEHPLVDEHGAFGLRRNGGRDARESEGSPATPATAPSDSAAHIVLDHQLAGRLDDEIVALLLGLDAEALNTIGSFANTAGPRLM